MEAGPQDALIALTALLRDERSVISPHVSDPPAGVGPALGELAAAGPRAEAERDDYAVVVEAVREGYLLHYGRSRILAGADEDLSLLAGDYLYATGLDRLARLGDLEAVRELSDLISLSAHLHAASPSAGGERAAALWLATAVAVGAGPSEAHEGAKLAAREGAADSLALLLAAAEGGAAAGGMAGLLDRAREAVGFASSGNLS